MSQQGRAWWLWSPEEALAAVCSRVEGLSAHEARRRLRRDGPNQFRDEPRHSLLGDIAKRFRNPLVMLLLVASAISGAMGQITNFVIIITMVLLSVLLDFVQEHRANLAAEKLRQSVLVRANVLRDGVWQWRPVANLVVGDVVRVKAGSLIPADGCLLQAADLHINQAVLTGESYPVEKRVFRVEDGLTLPSVPGATTARESAPNGVFMGTSVVAGTATILICAIGDHTAIGEVVEASTPDLAMTTFERSMRGFGLMIMRLTLFLVLFVLFANAITHKPWLDSLLFAVALAVGLTPELLPMVVSVALARCAMVMSGRSVIVKRLSAIEDLGAMDVLCTDKTGTLTEARVALVESLDLDGQASSHAHTLAFLNSNFETGVRTPMDDAVLAYATPEHTGWHKLGEIPFDFDRRRVSVHVAREVVGETATEHASLLVTKGAPEDVLSLCSAYERRDAGNDGQESQLPMEDAERQRARALYDRLGNEGFRVLAVAWKALPTEMHADLAAAENAMVCAGFLAFLDPPKVSAANSIRELATRGVRVKVVTGDNELVTRRVCHALGMHPQRIMLGSELVVIDDAQLDALVEGIDVFCRINPAQKKRIVEALRRRGNVVGFLGDGINDAPALIAADVGLSVDSAVDIAKEAADMILLKPDLVVLRDAVVEGRRTLVNIRKYVLMGTSSNFGNMFSMAGASLFLPFLAMLPTQILLNNILYDLSQVAIPTDRVDEVELASPQHWDMSVIRNFMLMIGPVSSLFDFVTFYLLLKFLDANESMFQTGWFIESLATQVLVIFVIRSQYPAFGARTSRPAWPVVVATLSMLCVAWLLTVTPVGHYFGFSTLPAHAFAVLVALVLIYLVLVEIMKMFFYRHFSTNP
ncbi:MAG: magnesium-translocating P-type ATPase [Rhodocyclaceae bacterium]|nr:magnesium-translocating P-type ATPase [Rhodocyclaceae bacterium]